MEDLAAQHAQRGAHQRENQRLREHKSARPSLSAHYKNLRAEHRAQSGHKFQHDKRRQVSRVDKEISSRISMPQAAGHGAQAVSHSARLQRGMDRRHRLLQSDSHDRQFLAGK